jgi:release factor glutamine methyltransferase
MPTLKERLDTQQKIFRQNNVEAPALSAELLLGQALGLERSALLKRILLEPNLELPETYWRKFEELCARRLTGEPIAYISGKKEFYGREFGVTPHTLIPRPETELLVDQARGHFQGIVGGTFADLGTGSGCIAITLALELEDWQGLALDFSEKALEQAQINAKRLGAAGLVFLREDFRKFRFEPKSLDLLAGNPPYVSQEEYLFLDQSIRSFEPAAALLAGPEGTECLAPIISIAQEALKAGGVLLLEIGSAQGAYALGLLQATYWQNREVIRDLAGKDRLLSAQRTHS